LKTEEWQRLFAELEAIQCDFLAKEPEFRSPEYQWPRDALHNWSRVWEYAYAYDFLRECRREPAMVVADLGSGVTFFPFAVARLGYSVICTDTDPVCAHDLPRAAKATSHAPGSLTFRPTNGDTLPFGDEELDAIYCISVLEHIERPENTVQEMARVLKPEGWLILTIDLDMNGRHQIGIGAYRQLRCALASWFDLAMPELTVHPADQLTTANSPYPLFAPKGFARKWYDAKQLIKPLLGRKPGQLLDYELCVGGFALRRRGLSFREPK
jgi:SAM-dependent methyltransferase